MGGVLSNPLAQSAPIQQNIPRNTIPVKMPRGNANLNTKLSSVVQQITDQIMNLKELIVKEKENSVNTHDPANLEKIEELEAELDIAQKNLNATKQERNTLKLNKQESNVLKQQLKNAQTAANSAKQELANARTAIETAKGNANTVRQQLTNSRTAFEKEKANLNAELTKIKANMTLEAGKRVNLEQQLALKNAAIEAASKKQVASANQKRMLNNLQTVRAASATNTQRTYKNALMGTKPVRGGKRNRTRRVK